jgi:two-component system, sensor histidine kinase LadS
MMAADTATLSALEAREQLNNALQSAWTRGSAESSPLALVLVAFDKPETAVGILEPAMKVHCARTNDVVLRRANDEFIAILPDTPPQGARRVGEQIVEAMRAAADGHTHRVSVGVAVAVPDEQSGPDELMRRAQSALEAAREKGGDTCVGGSAAGSKPPPKGALAHLRSLLPQATQDPTRRRRVD